MRRFNSAALYDALDTKRIQLKLSWSEIAKEVGVSASTIKRKRKGGRMEVDGMIAMVDWLGVPVEYFVTETRQ